MTKEEPQLCPQRLAKLSSVQATATQERERVSRGASDTGGTRGSPPTKGVADEVKLSSNALQLQEAERRLAQQPNVDQARVTAIRDALSAGTYRVDAAVWQTGSWRRSGCSSPGNASERHRREDAQ